MTPINFQLEQLEALAARHYPDNEAERNAWLVGKLKERLTEFASMLQRLPVKQMRNE